MVRHNSMVSHNNVTQPSQGRRAMKKRSIVIATRRTSVSVEDDFWQGLQEIAKQRHETLSHLVAGIDANRKHANLSSAIRFYVLGFYREQHQQHRAVLGPSITQSPTLNGFRPS